MRVLYDENGYITDFAMVGSLVDGVEVPDPEDADYFSDHYFSYRYADGVLTYDEDQDELVQQQEEEDLIRSRRETECFAVINRGQLWYELLTPEQKTELQIWYQAWLDAPSTGVIPERPAWL